MERIEISTSRRFRSLASLEGDIVQPLTLQLMDALCHSHIPPVLDLPYLPFASAHSLLQLQVEEVLSWFSMDCFRVLAVLGGGAGSRECKGYIYKYIYIHICKVNTNYDVISSCIRNLNILYINIYSSCASSSKTATESRAALAALARAKNPRSFQQCLPAKLILTAEMVIVLQAFTKKSFQKPWKEIKNNTGILVS